MTPTDYIIIALVAIVALAATWYLRGLYDSKGLSPEETALKVLAKAAAEVDKFKNPTPDALAAINAAQTRKAALVSQIQASVAKIGQPSP